MTTNSIRARASNGRFQPQAVPTTGVVEFTATDPLTGAIYPGRGAVVQDPGTGVLVVAPLAPYTLRVPADQVTAVAVDG